MEHQKEIEITTRDRVMRAWQNSMELARDYKIYAQHVDDQKAAELFSQFAESEGHHAAQFKDLLHEYQG